MTARAFGREAARIYVAGVGLVCAIAAALLILASAREARAVMPLGFGRLPATPFTAVGLALDNARVALLPFGLATLVGQSTRVRRPADLLLALLFVFNAAEIGAALAGYGLRTVVALAPHAPFELAAYSLAGACYLEARREPVAPTRLARKAAGCALLLAVAALLETYVRLRIR